jgi:hypothetical protein
MPYWKAPRFVISAFVLIQIRKNSVQKIEIIFNFIGELDFPAINQPITVGKGLNEKTA